MGDQDPSSYFSGVSTYCSGAAPSHNETGLSDQAQQNGGRWASPGPIRQRRVRFSVSLSDHALGVGGPFRWADPLE